MKTLLTQNEVALRWGISIATLKGYRRSLVQKGPPYITIGNKILYDAADIEEYESSQKKTSDTGSNKL